MSARPADPVKFEQRFVLVFDFCSSTLILEDLLRSECEDRWRNLLIDIKTFLRNERPRLNFELYKFIGDGWILLFPLDFPKAEFFLFLQRLCDRYEAVFKKRVRPVLSTRIDNPGITFGLDRGRLISVVMDGHTEYLGRPLNVASRLQAAIRDKDLNPQGKILMSKPVYEQLRRHVPKANKIYSVKRKLKNISGGEDYRCIKLHLQEVG
jgi:class 3 adenylate cyclase